MNDPQVVRFANERARPNAEKNCRAYDDAVSLLQFVDSTEIEATLAEADQEAYIDDGSDADGRNRIRVRELRAYITALRGIKAMLEAPGSGGSWSQIRQNRWFAVNV